MVKYRYMKLSQIKIIRKIKDCVFRLLPTSNGPSLLPSVIIGLLLSLFGGVLVASAQGYIPLVTLPGGITTVGQPVVLDKYLSGMIKLTIAVAGALAILMIVIGGTQYVAASINISAKSDAKDRITNSLIGLALVLSSWLLLNTINPKLVSFSLMLPPINTPTVDLTVVPRAGGTEITRCPSDSLVVSRMNPAWCEACSSTCMQIPEEVRNKGCGGGCVLSRQCSS